MSNTQSAAFRAKLMASSDEKRRSKQSLNQAIVDELTKATVGGPQRAEFSDLVGGWTPDPGFDDIMATQRRIDMDKWK